MIKRALSSIAFKNLLVFVALYVVTVGIVVSIFIIEPEHSSEFPLLRSVIIIFASILLTKYFIYMLLSPWHNVNIAMKRARIHRYPSLKEYTPKVSVLIPAWNEEEGVLITVKSLLGSTYQNMEILVINNASTDNTEQNVKDFIKKYKRDARWKSSTIEVKYFLETTQGKGHALNKGIEQATGEILLSIDADCFVETNTVHNFVEYFKDPEVMAAVGNVKIGNTNSIIGLIQYLEFLFSFYFKKADSLINAIYIIGGAAGAFRKEVFEKIGPYNTQNITEDIELSVRIQDAGMKIIYASDAVIFTEGASDIRALMRQRLRWKRGRFETFMDHRHLFFSVDKNHNKILTWLILPLAIFGEIQLSLELFFLTFLYVFSYLTNDYSSFISGIVVVSSMFIIQIAFDAHKEKRVKFMLLAPIGWLLFYVSTFVEFSALLRALWGYARGSELKWQQWKRKGVFSE